MRFSSCEVGLRTSKVTMIGTENSSRGTKPACRLAEGVDRRHFRPSFGLGPFLQQAFEQLTNPLVVGCCLGAHVLVSRQESLVAQLHDVRSILLELERCLARGELREL